MSWKQIDDYLAQRSEDAPSTQATYRNLLRQFQDFAQKRSAKKPSEVTPQHLDEYRKWLTWQPNKLGTMNRPNTIYLALRIARHFLKWSGNAIVMILPRPSDPKIELLEAAELGSLLTSVGSSPQQLRDFLILVLLAATDVGLSGCRALDVESTLELDEHLRFHHLTYLRQGRPRLAPTCEALLVAKGRRISVPTLVSVLVKAGQRIGLTRRLSARLLRKSYRWHSESLARRHPFFL